MDEITFPSDQDGRPIQVVGLKDSHDVDGTLASAKSNAIAGKIVRVVSTDNSLRVEVGEDPTATNTSIYIPAMSELWLPITSGHKVAVLGGIANVCTACN